GIEDRRSRIEDRATRFRSSFRAPRPTRQKNVRQKNEEDQTHSSFFCLTFFCLAAKMMIKAGRQYSMRSSILDPRPSILSQVGELTEEPSNGYSCSYLVFQNSETINTQDVWRGGPAPRPRPRGDYAKIHFRHRRSSQRPRQRHRCGLDRRVARSARAENHADEIRPVHHR